MSLPFLLERCVELLCFDGFKVFLASWPVYINFFLVTALTFNLNSFIFSPISAFIILLNQQLYYLFSSLILFNGINQFSPITIYPSNNHSLKVFIRPAHLSVRDSIWPLNTEQSPSFLSEKDFQSCSPNAFQASG